MPQPTRSPSILVLLVMLVACTLGCGKKGAPIPPEPRGPHEPERPTVRQIGPEVSVAFEVPPAKGSKPQQQPVNAQLIRVAYPPGFSPPPDADAFRRRGELIAEVDLAGLTAGEFVRIVDTTVNDLEGGGIGWTLRYAVRVYDQRGRPSRPAGTSDMEPLTSTPPPRNLTAEPTADGMRLKWAEPAPSPFDATTSSGASSSQRSTSASRRSGSTSRKQDAASGKRGTGRAGSQTTSAQRRSQDEKPADDERDVDQQDTSADDEPRPTLYNIYRTEDGQPFPEEALSQRPLAELDYLDGAIVTGTTYVYVVRTLLESGSPVREGASSKPVRVVAVDRFAPATPESLVVVQEGAAIRLFWDPNRETDLAGYRVYRQVDGGPWSQVGPDPVEQPDMIDRDVKVGQTVAYRVAAIDRADEINESDPSEPRELVVAAEPSVPGNTQGDRR